MDLIVYLVINVILLVFVVFSHQFWSVLGVLGGLVGAILTFGVLQETVLVIQTVYDPNIAEWVSQTIPMDWFAYVPLLLTFLNFITVIKHK